MQKFLTQHWKSFEIFKVAKKTRQEKGEFYFEDKENYVRGIYEYRISSSYDSCRN